MIPSVVAGQIRQAAEDFLQTRYPISTSRFARIMPDFVARGEAFKGPYISFQLPFRPGSVGSSYFLELPLPFHAHLHQEQTFERLSGAQPRPTIVATGTGSGKTEAFLYPILDYCRQHANEPGVKAIVIYPMNALATDQARRIADIIFGNDCLRDRITAGLYIGDRGAVPHAMMTEHSVITKREAMQRKPPDILLTNYKMLDYLMVRPRDAEIWKHNSPGTLKFIVVDELHTFDGAQGTDLACLIRRLKYRLRAPNACPVGTSATLGADDSAALCDYARTIFDAEFDDEAIITEKRLSARDYLGDHLIRHFTYPDKPSGPAHSDSLRMYIAAQYRAWFGSATTAEEVGDDAWRSQLGRSLRQHVAFHNLIKIVETHTKSAEHVAHILAEPVAGTGLDTHQEQLLLQSLLALISYARDPSDSGRALLNIRIQCWMRELKRMVVSLEKPATLVWSDDIKDAAASRYLPLVVCRNCSAAGWLARKRQNDAKVETRLKHIYEAFFRRHPDVLILYPDDDLEAQTLEKSVPAGFCLRCVTVNQPSAEVCRECKRSSQLLTVRIPDLIETRDGKAYFRIICVYCGRRNSISIVGAQSASLTSVAIGQLFGSRYNQDKKALTFSDSVQDASHRAGFFQARTFPFSVRTSLLQFIRKEGEGQPFEAIARRYVKALLDQYGDAGFVGTFIAPNLCWRSDYEQLVNRHVLPRNSNLVELVSKRLRWEVYQAFGLKARRGRSLENTLSAAAYVNRERLRAVEERIAGQLQNEFEELRHLSAHTLQQFLNGLIYRLRTGGGIMHPALESYIKHGGQRYQMDERHIPYMPRIARFSPCPAFITDGRSKSFLPIGPRTWLKSWAAKTLFADIGMAVYVEAVYRRVLDAAVIAELMQVYDLRRQKVWGLRADALQVTTRVGSCRCNACSYQVSIPLADRDLWQGMPCLRYACRGEFAAADADTERHDYYRTRYQSTDVQRFVAEEHTGLLERAEREEVEKAFMADERNPWDPNIISCTPTLELGIDIGDLSSVILCSVPPAQANYVQRIGRAGRRNGNALTLTVALGRPHDLYFFAKPEDMIAGHVQVPGTFLRAPAVLKRQLAAFAFDSWVARTAGATAVPRTLHMILGQLEHQDANKFPFNWLTFTQEHAEELSEEFFGLFAGNISREISEELKRFMVPASPGQKSKLAQRVVNAFAARRDERTRLGKRLERVRRHIKQLEKRPKDDVRDKEISTLRRDRRALVAARTAIGKMEVFNFLCDEGILPNYAFPQSSATLQSTIVRKEADRPPEIRVAEEFVRPGAAAIREFAPGNTFYAGGRHVTINQLDLGSAPIETWRLCDTCAYCARAAIAAQDHCPQCGAASWSGVGRIHEMVRMERVRSLSGDRESRSHDEVEERKRVSFQTRMHVQFSRNDTTGAFKCSKAAVPFGFEFVRRATFRIVNYGPMDRSGAPMLVAGEELDTRGFECCHRCGRVRVGDTGTGHEFTCKQRGKSADSFKKTFLYHEVESETLRMLLPVVSDGAGSRAIDSFCAALNMGLKDYFHGMVAHLQTTSQSEPISNAPERKTFVYLYDSVPGGTGYLRDLLRPPNRILKVLHTALQKLQQCPCTQDESKDGCYRCLFAYRNSWVRDRVSRSEAEGILGMILEQGGDLIKSANSLDEIDFNPLIESKCESRLLEALSRAVTLREDASFEEVRAAGRTGYQLVLGERTWTIDCQVPLTRRDGVLVPSRADFVFRPDPAADALPIAVFCDGFEFHSGRLGDDTAQRLAILVSGKYHVWAFTWNDLDTEQDASHFVDYILPKNTGHEIADRFLAKLSQQYALGNLDRLKNVRSADSLQQFMALLEEPDPKKWAALAYACAVTKINARIDDVWHTTAKKVIPSWISEDLSTDQDVLAGRRVADVVTFLVCSAETAVKACTVEDLQMIGHLDDGDPADPQFKAAWNGFLRAMNLFQYLTDPGFFCTTGLQADAYDPLEGVLSDREVVDGTEFELGWAEVREECADEMYAPLLSILEQRKIPPPEVGADVCSQEGRVIATTELAWPDVRLAVLCEDDADARKECANAGWQCYFLSEISADLIAAVFSSARP